MGIATKEALLQSHGYLALVGSDTESWGWNIVDNRILHNGESQGSYPQLNNPPKYQVYNGAYHLFFLLLSFKKIGNYVERNVLYSYEECIELLGNEMRTSQ